MNDKGHIHRYFGDRLRKLEIRRNGSLVIAVCMRDSLNAWGETQCLNLDIASRNSEAIDRSIWNVAKDHEESFEELRARIIGNNGQLSVGIDGEGNSLSTCEVSGAN